MATYDLTSSIPNASSLRTGDVLNCPYSGTYKSITLPEGTYKFECWGAQGGNGNSYNSSFLGGRGGYSVGTLSLFNSTIIYIYSGGQGIALDNDSSHTIITGGFNGGGNNKATDSWSIGSGGGASDIRIGTDSLYSRVIVAGGGGSSTSRNDNLYGGSGGDGGGISGLRKTDHSNAGYQSGYGASQTSGGSGYTQNTSGAQYVSNGTFGLGAGLVELESANVSGGGGGGWYGGGSGYCAGSGGGSGYVYTSSTYSNYPSGCLLNSDYYLTNASTIAGNTSFPSISGSIETGHSGNGYVRITIIKKTVDIPIRIKINGSIKEASDGFVKVGNAWKKITKAFYKSNGTWINN